MKEKQAGRCYFPLMSNRVVLVLDNGAIYQPTPDRGQGHQSKESITECIWYFGKVVNMKGWRSVSFPKKHHKVREYFYSIKSKLDIDITKHLNRAMWRLVCSALALMTTLAPSAFVGRCAQ